MNLKFFQVAGNFSLIPSSANATPRIQTAIAGFSFMIIAIPFVLGLVIYPIVIYLKRRLDN